MIELDFYQDSLIWEEKEGNLYLTVGPDFPVDEYDVDDLLEELNRKKIFNADLQTLDRVIQQCSGKAEYVGPPFAALREEKLKCLSLQTSPEKATLVFHESMGDLGFRMSIEELEFMLNRKGVRHGIQQDALQELVQSPEYEKTYVVAKATMPENGLDGCVEELVTVDPDAKPLMLDDGRADFRNIGTIRKIDEGDLIARRVPPTPGKPGMDIFGRVLVPTPGKNIELPRGENTVPSPDHKTLRARCTGYLYRASGNICVGEIYVVPKDLDYSSGNLEYSGDVVVRGNIKPGFRIKANGNILVQKDVESAHLVSVHGNIVIKGGVFGKNKTSIIAKEGGITVGIAQEAVLECKETLLCSKYLRSCRVRCKDLDGSRASGGITNCRVVFSGKMTVALLGSTGGGKNVVISENPELKLFEEKLALLEVNRQKLLAGIEEQKKEIAQFQQVMQREQAASGPIAERVRKGVAQLQSAVKAVELLEKKRQKLRIDQNSCSDRENLISAGKILPILELDVDGQCHTLGEEAEKVRVDYKAGKIILRNT